MSKKPKCRCCNRIVNVVSNKGLCPACSVRKNKTVNRQLINKKGKYYKNWKLKTLEALKKQPM